MATSVNGVRNANDQTVEVFNNFYNFSVNVPSNEFDVVFSYFKSITDNTTEANNFTVTLFQMSANSNTPVLTLLDEFKSKTVLEINSTLAYYLNNLRSLATLLGVQAPVTANQNVARNIVQ